MEPDGENEHHAGEHAVEHLSPGVCWGLLRRQSLGRLAVNGDDGHPAIFPVNYSVSGPGLFIKTASDAKLRLIATDPRVAFETDARDGEEWWSVVALGRAHQVTVDAERRRARLDMPLSASPAPKLYVIRVDVNAVTGRRFGDAGTVRSQRAREKHRTTILAEEMASSRPRPIPHQPPRS
ncbi:pyridoxamine 5'-phosphate oxidase family protein [Microbacterium sp. 22296]|uniref:pyridoxamine 5'-phosphate oxidase family protein n=1 Tax=Microbacterium sp. 22296 TaxID=3453903 RepID=UPI003F859EA8